MDFLYEALRKNRDSDMCPMHMPGHKGQDIPYGNRLTGWDVTELDGTDNLANPAGVIAVTEGAYRDAYGARASMLLVGGSTAGLLTMSLALGRGRRVLLGRDSHKSALSALALADHQARFLLPEVNPTEGLAGMLTPRQVEEALQAQPADAVLLTSPNYYGFCADVEGIADVAHAYGALLLVDFPRNCRTSQQKRWIYGALASTRPWLPLPKARYCMWASIAPWTRSGYVGCAIWCRPPAPAIY